MKNRKSRIALIASLGAIVSVVAFLAISVVKFSNDFKDFTISDDDMDEDIKGWDI